MLLHRVLLAAAQPTPLCEFKEGSLQAVACWRCCLPAAGKEFVMLIANVLVASEIFLPSLLCAASVFVNGAGFCLSFHHSFVRGGLHEGSLTSKGSKK